MFTSRQTALLEEMARRNLSNCLTALDVYQNDAEFLIQQQHGVLPNIDDYLNLYGSSSIVEFERLCTVMHSTDDKKLPRSNTFVMTVILSFKFLGVKDGGMPNVNGMEQAANIPISVRLGGKLTHAMLLKQENAEGEEEYVYASLANETVRTTASFLVFMTNLNSLLADMEKEEYIQRAVGIAKQICRSLATTCDEMEFCRREKTIQIMGMRLRAFCGNYTGPDAASCTKCIASEWVSEERRRSKRARRDPMPESDARQAKHGEEDVAAV